MRILALTGRAGAGKDSVADVLAARYRVYRFAFADALRLECAAAWGVDAEVFTRRDLRTLQLDALAIDRCSDAGFREFAWALGLLGALRPRTIMQQWGDYRRARDPDYWLPPLDVAIDRAWALSADALLVTDLRYPNELQRLHGTGAVVWRIERGGLPHDSHPSEWALQHAPVDDVIVNDGSVAELQMRVLDLASGLLGEAV